MNTVENSYFIQPIFNTIGCIMQQLNNGGSELQFQGGKQKSTACDWRSFFNPWCACTVKVTVVAVCVCLSVKSHLTSGVSVHPSSTQQPMKIKYLRCFL